MTRPRAADDFPAIRARMEELRRQRARASAEDDLRWAAGPRPYSEMLKERPHHNVVEVWAGNRWIYRAARETGPQVRGPTEGHWAGAAGVTPKPP